MAIEETRTQQELHATFRMALYFVLIFEIIANFDITTESAAIAFCLRLIKNFPIFTDAYYCKTTELILIILVSIGTKAKKALRFNWTTMVYIPCAIGLGGFAAAISLHGASWGAPLMGMPASKALYAVSSIIAVMGLLTGLDGISKYYALRIDQDRFNFENESFEQSRNLDETPYSVNIPMIFYHKKRMNHGWINIVNPFRGTIVLGTPGSGKSFGIIDPFIRQHSRKGFAMMVYDYKFPTLAKTLFYQYCYNRHYGKLPDNCSFRIVNFTDVEYSSRINPIQRKYIPDLAAATETASTLLASLNKGGGEKKGGSEAFFTNSAENFLSACIYYFVNLRPRGFRNGRKLRWFISYRNQKLELKYHGEDTLLAVSYKMEVDKNRPDDPPRQVEQIVLDFTDRNEVNTAYDADGQLVNLEGHSYVDAKGNTVVIDRVWYEDDNGVEVEPDTITGEFSDMPHVLALLGRTYDESFTMLMRDQNIASLMAPFQSAFRAKANDQLEGMVGTLRVNTARLVSPEAYWILSGDDMDLKISDPRNPCYLVIANDPEKEQIVGSLNALVLNRLVTRVNSKGNLPVSLIVDELPTLYFHKIDRLIGTARSNKVAVTLGFQELPQLEADYGKIGMQKIITTCGNVFMGAARNKETLEWAQNDIFGKVKQTSTSYSINDNKISTTLSEKVDYLVPASKIADMATGWLAGQSARDFTPTKDGMMRSFDIENSDEFKTTKYFCKTHFDMEQIKQEESLYRDIPKLYDFGDDREKNAILMQNFKRINNDIQMLVDEILGGATATGSTV